MINFVSKKFKLKNWQVVNILLVIYDVIAIYAAYFLALFIRFDLHYGRIPKMYLSAYFKFMPAYIVLSVICFAVFKLYRSVWAYVSMYELRNTVVATVITVTVHVIGCTLLFVRMPISYYVFGGLLQFGFILGIRFSYRFVKLLRSYYDNKEVEKNVIIIGAGSAGKTILKDIRGTYSLRERVVCFIDDDINKIGRIVDGVSIVGNRDDIMQTVEQNGIRKIYIAISNMSKDDRRELVNICKECGCETKILPNMYLTMKDAVSIGMMKDIQVEDLLGREQIKVNMDEIFSQIKGKVILITGAGGSIGSELARQIAEQNPKQLILFEIYENSVYDVQLELKKKHPELDLVVLIGSVRDSRRVFQVFEEYQPQMVYHAAAHKHVPLMEDSPCESIKNNVIGTYKTAYAAMVHGCERFLLISTDKAVNPTNIMGASKRLCEMIVQSFDRLVKEGRATEVPQLFTHEVKQYFNIQASNEKLKNVKTEFVAVRFGNVLGSNGSVIPIFKRQIEAGGPVTVTHPDIVRYFMTIPEAVSLVLQASVYARGGEIFVLDMGEPVKIDTLARNMVKLSGKRVGEDIEIRYVGLRPGEKLFEEKLMAEEGLKKTGNELIFIGSPIPIEEKEFFEQLHELLELSYKNKTEIKTAVQNIVGTYHQG